ncbi:hypothetical protein D1007_34266 [Hordeum vulgare]|nr:hypothetical protein D1007_34266 [Hordeum vulgare]
MVNAASSPKAQEKQGSSYPATKPIDGCTTTSSLARPSGLASHARPEMPQGRRALAMATELLLYLTAPDRHEDWLHRIEELITAAGDSAALSCSLRPQPCVANNEEQDVPPHYCGMSWTPSPGRKCDPAPDLVNTGRGPGMKRAARSSPCSVQHVPAPGIADPAPGAHPTRSRPFGATRPSSPRVCRTRWNGGVLRHQP